MKEAKWCPWSVSHVPCENLALLAMSNVGQLTTEYYHKAVDHWWKDCMQCIACDCALNSCSELVQCLVVLNIMYSICICCFQLNCSHNCIVVNSQHWASKFHKVVWRHFLVTLECTLVCVGFSEMYMDRSSHTLSQVATKNYQDEFLKFGHRLTLCALQIHLLTDISSSSSTSSCSSLF